MGPLLLNRRTLFAAAGATLAASHITSAKARSLPALPIDNPAADTGYWEAVRRL